MLAATLEKHHAVEFPVLATPKIDGIRALKIDGVLVSRAFKPIPNSQIRGILEELLPDGADGEITCGGFHRTTSVVMSHDKTAYPFVFYWFDWVPSKAHSCLPYTERVRMIQEYADTSLPCSEPIVSLIPDLINNQETLAKYESQALSAGYEGVMLRRPEGKYKYGRSTLSEGFLVKLKRYQDSEATVIGAEELMHNNNEPQLNNFGMTVRQRRQEHLVSGNTLGALIAQTISPEGEMVKFKIGTGYTDELRASLWASRHDIVGKLVKYRYMGYGNKVAPRCPVFIGIRHADDVCTGG